MANIRPKMEFEPVELTVGQGWCVRVTLPKGKQPQLGNFHSEVEAQEWIRRRSLAWLKKYERARRR
jgi:hypothetical protein